MLILKINNMFTKLNIKKPNVSGTLGGSVGEVSAFGSGHDLRVAQSLSVCVWLRV